MRKGLRLRQESFASLKHSKKQVVTRTAQRKFASNVQNSPSVRESTQPQVTTTTPKTEDFINFLCLRDAPFLPSDLERFADPIYVCNPQHDEIFRTETDNESSLIDEESGPSKAKRRCFDDEEEEDEKNDDNANDEPPVMTDVEMVNPTNDEFIDFFQFLDNEAKSRRYLVHIKPSSDWKCLSYVQEGLKIEVETLHVHRLKLPTCENFMKLQVLKKHLEKEGVSMKEIPCLGLCELDLPHLMEVVNSFGGVDSVNSDQNWRALAEQLRIPKTASRRVTHLEKIYLKYILSYDLLRDSDKTKLRNSVKNDTKKVKAISKSSIAKKPITLETFHRMACNSLYYYNCEDESNSDSMEKQFWKVIEDGTRHIAAYSGEIDLFENPQPFQNSKVKVPWKLSTLYTHEKSALKYLGKVSKISVPWLSVESVFSFKTWKQDENDFYTLSYLHAGSDKIWYVIPPEFSKKISLMNKEAEKEYSMLTPQDMLDRGVQVLRCVQKEGQYVIVEPGCHFCTLSTGYSLSETVKFMTDEWYDTIANFDLKLSDYIQTKMLLNFAAEAARTANNPYNNVLIEKLDSLNLLLTNSVARLTDVGVEDFHYLKTKPQDPDICNTCDQPSYLVSVTFEESRNENDECNVYCLDHALKMIKSKKSRAKEATGYVLVSISKINQMIAKLRFKTGK